MGQFSKLHVRSTVKILYDFIRDALQVKLHYFGLLTVS